MTIKKALHLLYTALLLTGLTACGGSDSKSSEPEGTVPETPAQPIPTEVTLGEAMMDINLGKAQLYSVTLDSDAENLVISFAKGFQQTNLGDPDIYVKFDQQATTENFDCVSYNGAEENETCIINKPKAGKYSILVDVANNTQVTNATLWTSIELLSANQLCNDMLTIRAQTMSSAELDKACAHINKAKTDFFNLFSNISPAPETPVTGDLNDHVNMTVFSSLSNHTRWIDYLFNDSENRSGIFYEGTPNEWYHGANIVTFNPIEWTDGYSLVRSDNHEFIHALDGRYNKAGGYRQGLGWWSEGLAEYLTTTAYDKYKLSLTNDDAGNPYTLTEIFKGFSGDANPYDGGQLAVMFFLEQHPELVTQLLTQSREGNWDQWDVLLSEWATTYQTEFSQWLSVGPKAKFEQSAKSLPLNEATEIVGRHGWLYALEVTQATASLTIQLHGNQASTDSMDLDLYVSKDNVPTLSNYDCDSQTAGSNETCSFANVTPGTYYITLNNKLTWAADYIDTYLTACAGAECSVTLPERLAQKAVVDFAIPLPPEVLPDVNTFATCNSVRPYERGSDAASVTVTNTTEVPVKLYWINNTTGEPNFSSAYATLSQGESYTADYWANGDRMIVTDSSNNCLGVAIMQQAVNDFQIDADLVKDAVLPELSAIGQCDLAVPYTRSNDSATITITNKTSTPVTLYWVNNSTGEPNIDNAYATLDLDEVYTADFWAIGDRMMITGADNSCFGIADLTQANNIFEVDSSIVP